MTDWNKAKILGKNQCDVISNNINCINDSFYSSILHSGIKNCSCNMKCITALYLITAAKLMQIFGNNIIIITFLKV